MRNEKVFHVERFSFWTIFVQFYFSNIRLKQERNNANRKPYPAQVDKPNTYVKLLKGNAIGFIFLLNGRTRRQVHFSIVQISNYFDYLNGFDCLIPIILCITCRVMFFYYIHALSTVCHLNIN